MEAVQEMAVCTAVVAVAVTVLVVLEPFVLFGVLTAHSHQQTLATYNHVGLG
jgi:hypothetical protein